MIDSLIRHKTLFKRLFVAFVVLTTVAIFIYFVTQTAEPTRIEKLLSAMSMDEKIGQMTQLTIGALLKEGTLDIDPEKLQMATKKYMVGSFFNSPFSESLVQGLESWNVSSWLHFTTSLQKASVENSPNKIPMLYALDSMHGANYVKNATLFPHNLGLAATFNPSLVAKAGVITTKDTYAAGVPWVFAPVNDLGVQPLWPRFYETWGEDPYLSSVMADAVVKGIEDYKIDGTKRTASCAKHYLGYSDPQNGKDRNPVWIPDNMLKRYYVPPFNASVRAGTTTVMINSGSLNGVPIHSSYKYLTTLLRDELGFEGVAVTDWEDILKLFYFHKVAPTVKDAVLMAINAGVDMSMDPMTYTFSDLLKELVNEGKVSEERIDLSVKRILVLKENLGLLDDPYPDLENPNIASVGSLEDYQTSEEITRETITLLKNNEDVLPIQPDFSGNILVTGPAANSLVIQNGGWTIHWQGAFNDGEFSRGATIFDGMQSEFSSANVTYVEGCNLTHLTDSEKAYQAAAAASYVVVCLGEEPMAEFLGDIDDLTFSEAQLNFVTGLSMSPAKIILVLIEARPRLFTRVEQLTNAVIMAYLPGSAGGTAISEVISGKVNPSGKLPITYPAYVNDIRVPYYHKPTALTNPLYTFGHGLSYTTFSYTNLTVQSQFTLGSNVSVSVIVENNGTVTGDETVILYLSDVVASVVPEVKMMKAFEKITLEPGQTQKVEFTLTPWDFMFVDQEQNYVTEQGMFLITTGHVQANTTLV